MRLAAAIAEMLIANALAYRVQHPILQILMDGPEHVLRDLIDVVECPVPVQSMAPVEPEKTVEQVAPFECDPRWNVNAVRHVVERILLCRHLRPEALQHLGAQLAVDPRHAVLKARSTKRKRRHVEFAVARRAAEREQRLALDGDVLAVAGEIFVDHRLGKMIVARRNGGVRREHGARGHGFERAFERQSGGHEHPRALEHQKRRVAFVHVPIGGRKP